MALVAIAAAGIAGKGHKGNDSDDDIHIGGGGAPRRPRVKTIKLYRDTSTPRDVYSWFEITLQEVNVPNQTFTASVEVHCFWQDFSLPSFVNIPFEEFKLDDDCVPVKLSEVFENKLTHEFDVEPKFQYNPDTSTIYMFFVSLVVFSERLELQRFPLDRQFLNMKFNAWVKEGNWNWIVNYPTWVPVEFHKPIAVRMTSSVTEYDLLSPWVDFDRDQPLEIRLRVDRKPDYYLGNIIMPNFLIVASCFGAFVVPRASVSTRLGITITLMLSAVAFRFVVSAMLPKVSYLTWMDYYVLAGFLGLMIFIGENAIAGLSTLSKSAGFNLDLAFCVIFGIAWLIMHIIIVVVLLHDNWGRIPWKTMDELDHAEDDEEEFLVAAKEDTKGNTESAQSTAEWKKYKNMAPMKRAKNFLRANIELATKAGLNLENVLSSPPTKEINFDQKAKDSIALDSTKKQD